MRFALRPKTKLAAIACFVVFLLNAAGLALHMHSYGSEYHTLPFYPSYLTFRGLLLRPLTLFAFAAIILYLLALFFGNRRSTRSDLEEVILVLAIMSTTLGLILTAAFKF
ncbi:MAG TPA: hypothetical protein VOA41_10755 [Candidatus Dormibacteraeota bacterium]|nr:hypothetical protein [Candidatus Dormibacteraeota bacterium]